MFVVEGPDGGGKTTLAEAICERVDLEYRRPPGEVLSSSSGPRTDTGLIEWWLREVRALEADRHYRFSGIYDRTTFISDPIYRLATGGRPQGTERQMMEGICFLSRHAYLIFCLPPFEDTLRAVHQQGRDKLSVDDEMLYNIWWAYYCQYHLWKEGGYTFVYLYDYTNPRHRDYIIEEVERIVEQVNG